MEITPSGLPELAVEFLKNSPGPTLTEQEYRVTMFNLSPLQVALMKIFPDAKNEDLLSSWKARVGTAVHSEFAKIESPKIVHGTERLKKEFHGFVVYGTFDFVWDGILVDLKTTSAESLLFKDSTEQRRNDHVFQLSAYKYLIKENKLGILKNTEIAYNLHLFTDWKQNQTWKKGYPKSPFLLEQHALLSDSDVEKKMITFDAEVYEIKSIIRENPGRVEFQCDTNYRWKHDLRCRSYCSVSAHCPYYKKNILEKFNDSKLE